MTGSLSCHKQVAGTTRGWESPMKGASYKVRHRSSRSSLCITNQAVWVRERRGRAGRRDTPLNELLDHLHACIELIQGENVLLGEEPQPWTLPEVLQGQQRQSYGGPASSWGRQTAHTHTPALTPLMTPMVRMGPGAGCTFPPHGSAGQAEVKSRSVLCWTLSGRRSVWSLVTLGNYKFFGASHLHL